MRSSLNVVAEVKKEVPVYRVLLLLLLEDQSSKQKTKVNLFEGALAKATMRGKARTSIPG